MARFLLLAVLLGCHPAYRFDGRPRNLTCDVVLRDPVIAPGGAVHLDVALSNRGPAHTWIGRRIERANTRWLVDGRSLDELANQEVTALLAAGQAVGFSGPTGVAYGRDDVHDLAPHRTWRATIEVFELLARSGQMLGTAERALSDHALLRRALDVPGPHALQLVVTSGPADAYFSDVDVNYDAPSWEAPCNAVTVEVRGR